MRNPLLVEWKIYRKRAKRAKWERERNFFLNTKPEIDRSMYSGISNPLVIDTTLRVPNEFHTRIDINKVLKFIAKCKSDNITRHGVVVINFKEVTKVNAGALSLLLSVIQDLTDLNIQVKGNMPDDLKARQEFIDSGFLEFFKNIKGGGTKSESKNKIIVKGHDKTNQIRTGEEIKKAMKTVFDKEIFNTVLQGTLIEMMANSLNHAFPDEKGWEEYFFEPFVNDKRWYFSASHDREQKKVQFSFIDNGAGIVNTIKRGYFRKIVENVTGTDILKKAFDGGYQSRTDQEERGLGLPLVKKAHDTGAIKYLKVLTNGYLYDFDNQIGTNLTTEFQGTCYFWELDNTCIYANT